MKIAVLCLCYGVLLGILVLSWIEIFICIKHLWYGRKKKTKESEKTE